MRIALAVFLAVLLLTAVASADGIKQVEQHHNIPSFLGYVPDRFIVVMKPDAGDIGQTLAASAGVHIGDTKFDRISDVFGVASITRQFKGAKRNQPASADLARYYKVSITKGNLESAMDAYRQNPLVEHVEPIGIHSMYATPSDFYYSYQWHLNQASDHDIDAPEAWDIEVGQDNTIVAILDSGTRYYHPDLGGANASPSNPGASRGNMWINNTELNGSAGVDDDGNGYVDDWIGYDFISSTSNCWPGEDCNTQDNDPRDFNGHGTHTSGIFGMITNDGYGMCGVAGGWGNGTQQEYGNGVKIMACRMGFSYNYLGQEYGVVYMDAAAEAFYYAADNGAKIASCSWGSSNSGGIGAAVSYFIGNGGIVCVAAGNDGSQTADYLNGRGDCISVAATNESDNAASFTTYGTWVDICAPGNNIYSTYHDHTDPNTNYWAALSGTSMATPMVAGTVALIWSHNPSWTASQVATQLYSSADNIDAYLSSQYIGKMGAGRINAYNAVFGGCDLAADFSGDATSGCAPLTVNFTDLSTGTGIDGWDWDFGDGSGTSTAQNPSYNYTSAGTYTVTLTVSSTSQGCNDSATKTGYITVSGSPVADFSGSPVSGTEPLTVDFTDLSTDATGWSWDFGDGVGTSAQQNPSYTYNSVGTYTVTLTASNACGSDIAQKVNYITVSPCVAPVADFSGTPTSGDAPLQVDFSDLSSGNPTSWSWDFGDGVGTSSQQNPTYTYNDAGNYTVTLTATNACGSDGETKVAYISVQEPPAGGNAYALSDIPVAGTVTGSYLQTQASDNSREQIQERQSGGKPSNRYSYLEHKWNFSIPSSTALTFYLEGYRSNNSDGDDFVFAYSTDDANYTDLLTVSSATEQVYSASIPSSVSGTVYIRVTDTDQTAGNNSEDVVYVDEMYIAYSTAPCTETAPSADFSGSPTSGDAPLTVNFTDLSTNNPASWSWDFGDGGSSSAQNPSYQYSSAGIYTVTLTATNCAGSDIAVKTDYVTVNPSSDYMYVSDMQVGRKIAGPNSSGTCTVTIFSSLGQPVENATVYVTATGPTGGNYNGLTLADGTVSFETGKIKNATGEWCFEVTNVTHATYPYSSGDNAVTYACESGWVYGEGRPGTKLTSHVSGLEQNHPNPFNAGTNVSFTLSNGGQVDLTVYDVLGRTVRHLANGFYSEGTHTVQFDGTDDHGHAVASGMYFYRLTTAELTETRKMILLK